MSSIMKVFEFQFHIEDGTASKYTLVRKTIVLVLVFNFLFNLEISKFLELVLI